MSRPIRLIIKPAAQSFQAFGTQGNSPIWYVSCADRALSGNCSFVCEADALRATRALAKRQPSIVFLMDRQCRIVRAWQYDHAESDDTPGIVEMECDPAEFAG